VSVIVLLLGQASLWPICF